MMLFYRNFMGNSSPKKKIVFVNVLFLRKKLEDFRKIYNVTNVYQCT